MKLTKRDDKILAFLEAVTIADTSTLNQIFFNNCTRACQRRLKILTDYKIVKRLDRKYLNQEYIYYLTRAPRQIRHKLLFSQLLGHLDRLGAEIIKFKSPYKLGNVVADGFICYKLNNRVRMALVEAELSKELNKDKYRELIKTQEFKDIFPVVPLLIVISDHKPYTMKEIKIINIKTDFSNIEDLL